MHRGRPRSGRFRGLPPQADFGGGDPLLRIPALPTGGERVSVVALRGEEREVALAEVQAVLAAVPASEYRDRLDTIQAALEVGEELGDDDTGELERLITIALQSGRVRALYGPGGEQALLRVFRRLPGGVELSQSATAVTDALAELHGKPLEQVAITAVGPGAFTLALAAGGLKLTIRLDRHGARLASVEA